MDLESKFNLITRGLQEIIGETFIIKKIINKRPLKIYWGITPTGIPHLGLLFPLIKITDFLRAGCEVTILIADLHAYLDSVKSSFELLSYRSNIYETMIKECLKSVGVDMSNLKFATGTCFQLGDDYTLDVYKLNSLCTIDNLQKIGFDVVKQNSKTLMTSLLYPTLQALDEEYLKADVFFGDIEQKHICLFAREYMPQLGYKKRIYFLNPIFPSIMRNKNNSTEVISMIETYESLLKKINKVYCNKSDPNNILIILIERIIFPILEIKKERFCIDRKENYGEALYYDTFESFIEDYKQNKIHPTEIKINLVEYFYKLFESNRIEFSNEVTLDMLLQAKYV